MKPWRRITGWLALLSVVLYGLLPSLAAFAARPVPASCVVATAQNHVCSCRPDPHGLGDCCCGDHGGNDCSLGKLPCDAGPAADGSLSALSHPLAPAPFFTAGHPLFRAHRVAAPTTQSLRVVIADLHAPPPRLA